MSHLVTPVLLRVVKPKHCYNKSLRDKRRRKQRNIAPEYSKKQLNASIIEVEWPITTTFTRREGFAD